MPVQRENFNPRPLLGVEETALLSGETRSTRYRAVKAGTLPLPVLRIGSRIRIPRLAVENLIAGQDPGHAAPPTPLPGVSLQSNRG
jgi:predicted DNA-binding transcriptional regulator AlpA